MAMSSDERRWMIDFHAYVDTKFREHETKMANLLALLQEAETTLKNLVPKIQPALAVAEEVVSDLHLTTAQSVLGIVQQLATMIEQVGNPTPATPAAPATPSTPAPAAPVAPVAPAPAPAVAPAPSVPGPH